MEVENREADYGKGFVYVLQDPTNSSIFKVGITNRSVRKRANELYQSSGVPLPFVIKKIFHIDSRSCPAVERRAHKTLKQKGFHHGKEWFDCTLKDCVHAIEDAIYELTDEKAVDLIGQAEQRRQEEKKKRQAKLKWEAVVSNHLEETNKDITNLREIHVQSLAANKKSSGSDTFTYVISLAFFWIAAAFFVDNEILVSLLFTGAGIFLLRNMKSVEQEEFYKLASDKYPYKTKHEIENMLLAQSSKDSDQASGKQVDKESVQEEVVDGSLSRAPNISKPEMQQKEQQPVRASSSRIKREAGSKTQALRDTVNKAKRFVNGGNLEIGISSKVKRKNQPQAVFNSEKPAPQRVEGQHLSYFNGGDLEVGILSKDRRKNQPQAVFNSEEPALQPDEGQLLDYPSGDLIKPSNMYTPHTDNAPFQGPYTLKHTYGIVHLRNKNTKKNIVYALHDVRLDMDLLLSILQKKKSINPILQQDFDEHGAESFEIVRVQYASDVLGIQRKTFDALNKRGYIFYPDKVDVGVR